jgi:membrane protease YdiL (CAAX protease family)
MKRPILIYVIAALFLSWVISVGGMFAVIIYGFIKGPIVKPLFYVSHALSASAFVLAALFCIQLFYKNAKSSMLFEGLKPIKISQAQVWVIASPLFLWATGLLLLGILKGEWFDFSTISNEGENQVLEILALLSPILCYAVFGEIGLRGFVLPHLQEKHHALKASIITAIIWTLLLSPLLTWRLDLSVLTYLELFCCILMGSIILTHLYNTNRGMILPGILFHIALNLTFVIASSPGRAALSIGLILLSSWIIWRFGMRNLSNKDRLQNYFREKPAAKLT